MKLNNHQVDSLQGIIGKVYPKVIPKKKHIQIRKETFTVEGYGSLLRYFLAHVLEQKLKVTPKA